MNSKTVAIGVVAVLVIAAVGGIVFFTQQGDKDSSTGHELKGKWNLTYIEVAELVDHTTNKPFLNAKDCKIVSHTINPKIEKVTLDIQEMGKHVMVGKFRDHDISGSFNGMRFEFQVSDNGHHYILKGINKGDHISLSAYKYGVYNDGTNEQHLICGVSYMMFIPEGKDPVSYRSDWVNTHVLTRSEHVKTVIHSYTDFQGEKDGMGHYIDVEVSYVKCNSLVTLFNITTDDEVTGVQAMVSLGTSSGGIAHAYIAGNNRDGVTDSITAFMGDADMANGKIVFTHHVRHAMLTGPSFVVMEYNVPYYDGAAPVPRFIEKNYEGTVREWTSRTDSVDKPVTRSFRTYNNVLYSETVIDGKSYIWFGEIRAGKLDITILGPNEFGRLNGFVDDDGNIHLFGKTFDKEGVHAFLDFDLHPVKA